MNKLLKSVLLLAAGLIAFPMKAQMPQQLPPLPVDSAVTVGKLDNGLTYYIRHNNTPKGQVDFYIAQKVGSILEEENQRGLAHFLEHMCFNGTDNFPGNSLIDWLESVGVKFGHNLNAYTSVDETVYRINNVPATRKEVVDSCLLILHDWACALTLDPDEIDSERKVIHEEWRQSMAGEMRVLEKLLPEVYPDNRYGHRLPIGTMDVVDNFPYQALIDYYHTWYRPDQQGIIVVGDIDPAYIESKIKEYFSPIKMPDSPKERVYFPVDDNPGTIIAVGADPEVRNSQIMMMFKTEPMLPKEFRNTQAFFPVEYLKSMVTSMLNSRLSELAKSPASDFTRPGAVCDLLKCNRDGGRFFKGGEKILVLLHIGKQRFNGKVGKLLALGLRNIKDGYNLKGGDGDFLFFLYHFSLAVKHGLSRFGGDFINQLFHLVGRGGKDFNAFLAFLYMAVKLLFPLTEAHYQIAALHSN